MLAAVAIPVVLLLASPPLSAEGAPYTVPLPSPHWQAVPVSAVRWNQAGSTQQAPATSSRPNRKRRILIGALVGFGIGFPVGAATAGYVGDTNNPRTGARIENGARFGALGAGIGALIGALTGKK